MGISCAAENSVEMLMQGLAPALYSERRCTEKLSRNVQKFPIMHPHTCTASPSVNFLYHRYTFVTVDESTVTVIIIQTHSLH